MRLPITHLVLAASLLAPAAASAQLIFSPNGDGVKDVWHVAKP